MHWQIPRWFALVSMIGTVGPAGAQGTPAAPGAPAEETAPATVERPTLELTLQDAIAIARRNNPALRIAEENRQRAADRRAEARALRLPQISIAGSYTLQGPSQEFTVQVPEQPPRRVRIVRTTIRQLNAIATLDTDLSGQIRSQQRIARFGAQAAASDVRTRENELIFAVTQAYADVLRAKELIRVRQEAVGAAREQFRVAEAQFRAGVVPHFDVLRASVEVENLRQDQIAAENAYRTAQARFINILNVDPATQLELAPLVAGNDTLAAPAPPGVAARPPTPRGNPAEAPPTLTPEPLILGEDLTPELRRLLAEAYRQRPEIQSAERNLRAAKERVRFERRARYPDLNIQAQVNHNPDVSGFASAETTHSVTATVSLPIFTGGLIRARIRDARDEADAARFQLEQVRQAVAVEVRTALLNLREAEARLAATAANVAQAREALRIARVRYQAGVSTSVELIDAEVALTQAQTNQVNAAYDVVVARADLQRALGSTAI